MTVTVMYLPVMIYYQNMHGLIHSLEQSLSVFEHSFKIKRLKKNLKIQGIRFFTKFNAAKALVVEGFNRTLNTKIWKYFTAKKTLLYIDVLQDLV